VHYKLTRIFLLFAMSLLFTTTALCQVDTGSVLGTVRDTSGAVMPGVNVTLTNSGTGQTVSTKTGSVGEYTFVPVRVGKYSVEAEMTGFQKVQQNNVTVDVQQHVQVDLAMTLGQASETVTVNTAPAALQTQDASVGQVIGQQAINDLPLNGRNFTFLAQLSAGVNQSQQDTRGLGSSGSFAANGLRPAQNNYLLDGIDNNSNLVDFLNGTSYAIRPPVDAIQEFKVATNNYSADTGRSAGAVLNATVRSGTNEFHGAAWEFFRNDHLDAANYFENANGLAKGRFQQNQFGATLGGPIIRNKTFFFVDYEGERVNQAIPFTSTVVTATERNSGYTDFSELLAQGGTVSDVLGRSFALGQIFDPSTTRNINCGVPDVVTGISAPCPSGTAAGSSIGFAREAFAGNILPAGRLEANSMKLLDLYPSPNNTGLFNNYASNPISNNTVDQMDARVDHVLTQRDNIFGRFSYVDNPEFIPGPFGGIADGGSFSAGNQAATTYSAALGETHVFSSTLVNEVRLGYNRLSVSRLQPNAGTPGIPASFGIPGVQEATSNGGLGGISISGLSTLGSNGYLPSIELSTNTQISDNVTKTMGRETFKVGFQWQRLGSAILQPPNGRGSWSFSGLYTEIPTTTGGNTGVAQMLLTPINGTVPGAADNVGGADSISVSNFANTSMKHNYLAGYFQDDVKVTPKLTLNLGVRYEYFGQLIAKNGTQSNFVPSYGSGASQFLIAQKGCSTPLSDDFRAAAAKDNINIVCSSQPGLGVSQKGNFAPRVGFAYQMFPKLVVRGGYGIFYGGFENSVVETYVDFPFQYNLNYPYLTPNAPITFSNGTIGTLTTGLTGIPLSSGLVEPGGVGFLGEDYHLTTPNTQGYNLTLQYQLATNDTIQVSYVGNSVHHLGSYTNPNSPNQILPPGLNSYDYSPYPDFPGMTVTRFNTNSHYNGLQTNYEHRFTQGLYALANLTWASCMTNAVDVLNNTALTGFRAAYLPGFGQHGDFGRCEFDTNKVLHISGTYELPIGRDRKFLSHEGRIVNAIVGGWDTNGILTLQDGQPGTVPCAITTTSGFGCNADKVPGQNPNAGPHNVNQWLNAAAYTNPPVATTIGQSDYSPLGGGPSNFRGPGFHRLDFSVFKQFPITERFRAEFRAEFFNLTNHPNFSLPGFGGNGVTAAPGALNFLNTSNFGKITSTRDGQNDQREIQFAVKIYY
jgi:Carboxypeptidase regulatory-like domain/TonB dependent receptor-like, beta-barrel